MLSIDVLRLYAEVARRLERLRVPCAVGGSQATSLPEVPRSTSNTAPAPELRDESVRPVGEAQEDAIGVDEERARDAVTRRALCNLIELASIFKVAVFVRGRGRLDEHETARRKRITLSDGGEELQSASAEETILQGLHR